MPAHENVADQCAPADRHRLVTSTGITSTRSGERDALHPLLDGAIEVRDFHEVAAAVPSGADVVDRGSARHDELIALRLHDVDDRLRIEHDRASELAGVRP